MNFWLLIGAVTTIVVAVAHSVLGEILIFRRMREGGIVPTSAQPIMLERHVRILWATWHVVTIFGLGIAAILYYIAVPERIDVASFTLTTVGLVMGVSGLLVLYATKGKHPGWVGLLVVCATIILAQSS